MKIHEILKSRTLCICVVFLWMLPLWLWADANPDADIVKGEEIARKSILSDKGFKDQMAVVVMELKNRQGETSIKKIRSKTLEQENDGDKTLIIFDEPKDIQGTAFLSFTHVTEPDDQWLYLPSLKRVKRISSYNKSGPFMGSEFAYEDITSDELGRFEYKYLREETFEDMICDVVERKPLYPKSGYVRQVAWYDRELTQLRKIDFYDRKDELLKTLYFKDYHQYLDYYWRAHQYHMINHQNGKETLLTWQDFKFNNAFTERDFDQASLKYTR